MKPEAVLISAAQEDLIDVPALVRALADSKLKAAGLDVRPQEPMIQVEAEIFRTASESHDLTALVANYVLLEFPNVIVTQHATWSMDGSAGHIIETTLDTIEAHVRGRPPNAVAAS